MTGVALHIRADVRAGLGGRTASRAVTVIAATGRAGVVEPAATDEGRGRMTVVAIQPGCDVGVMHASRCITIMAGRAVVHDAGMIEHCSCECRCIMADTAILVGGHVTGRFPDREHVVVTGSAVVDDAGMVEGGWYEAGGDVASVAVITGRHVVGRWCLARGGRTVMARRAVTGDAGMVEPGIGEVRGDMTQRAVLRRRQMAGMLAGRCYTIVAR